VKFIGLFCFITQNQIIDEDKEIAYYLKVIYKLNGCMPELERHLLEHTFRRKTRVNIQRQGGDQLGKGLTEGTVNRTGITLIGEKGKTRDVHMAEKVFDHPDLTPESKKEAISKILKIHVELKAHGFPTVSTMRTEVGNEQSIFMTDLTQNGKNEVVSVPDWGGGPEREGKFFQTDYKVVISNAEQLSQSLADLFEQTVEKGCLVAYPDAFFMIVNKTTKEGSVIFGDLLEINFISVPDDPVLHEFFMDNNFEIFRSFILGMTKHTQSEPLLSMKPLIEVRKKYLDKYRRLRDKK
jgi:hypothetical protein